MNVNIADQMLLYSMSCLPSLKIETKIYLNFMNEVIIKKGLWLLKENAMEKDNAICKARSNVDLLTVNKVGGIASISMQR
ncbi:hypothetical protein NC651_026725 [Populus alba x Populus x berolinensis]|nr:hypothetical protein NC651_026725 [Populus alba x Populus x berolinensis]